jgi:hypothetical protein
LAVLLAYYRKQPFLFHPLKVQDFRSLKIYQRFGFYFPKSKATMPEGNKNFMVFYDPVTNKGRPFIERAGTENVAIEKVAWTIF